MSNFGAYITNEYGLLNLILSYLPSKDLLAASKVCVEWKEVALRILAHRNKPKSYFRKKGKRWEKFCQKIHPKVTLHFSGISNYSKSGVRVQSDFISKLDSIYSMWENSIFNIYVDSWYITSIVKGGELTILNESGKNSESLLMLTEMRGVKIDLLCLDMCTSVSWRSEETDLAINVEKISNSKCFILFTNGAVRSKEAVSECLMSLPNPHSLVMVGGITPRLTEVQRSMLCYSVIKHTGTLGISFSGENVTAHSDLLTRKMDIDVFLQNLAKKVGPKPAGSVRIAFMFVCIDRTNFYEKHETYYFAKYFPSVPVYGFASLGEYCIRNPMIDEVSHENCLSKKRKLRTEKIPTDSDVEFFYQQSTAYLVITFKKV